MSINVQALLYNFKRNRERFANLRDELHKAGYTDREIVQAMADSPLLANPLGSPKRAKFPVKSRKIPPHSAA